MNLRFLLHAVFAFAIAATVPHATAGLLVHEWGTFTSLQDESGRALGGINTDDEPVPAFVHDVSRGLVFAENALPPAVSKAINICHPDVTMRLETPVLYFHANGSAPKTVDVFVDFHGGWLTQFYPDAVESVPGLDAATRTGRLTRSTVGRLAWRGLSLSASGRGPQTDDRVWLAPRDVDALHVSTPAGESEKFLFYRGVGHLAAPLQVCRRDGTLEIHSSPELSADIREKTRGIREAWLADIRAGGTAAIRTIKLEPESGGPLAVCPAAFPETDYSADAVPRLRALLEKALVEGGLFDDEASALLNTWEASYFQSSGTRLFFLVPQTWTDEVLPLRISGNPEVKRVMVGRIELVTPSQRKWLQEIATGTVPEIKNAATSPAGRAYASLGRFRDALVLDELRRSPTPVLERFAAVFGLAEQRIGDR